MSQHSHIHVTSDKHVYICFIQNYCVNVKIKYNTHTYMQVHVINMCICLIHRRTVLPCECEGQVFHVA